jgi:hypothetical protein
MDGELERIWKEAVVAYSRYCPGIRLEGLWNVTKNFNRIAGVSAGIGTQHFPNKCVKRQL